MGRLKKKGKMESSNKFKLWDIRAGASVPRIVDRLTLCSMQLLLR